MIHPENVLKISLQDVLKASWKRLEDVLKISWRRFCTTFWRRLEDVLKTPWRCLQNVLKTFLQDVSKTYSQDEYIGLDQDILKTSSEDVRLRQTYSPWWRRLLKTKTKNIFKTSSRHLYQDECLLGYYGLFENYFQ